MNLTLLDIIIISIILIIVIEYKKNNKDKRHIFITLFLVWFIFYYNWLFDSNLFFVEFWKWGFLFIVSGLFITIIELIKKNSLDVYCLIYLVFIGSVILITSSNLVTLYLGLELQTFSIFILIAKNRLSIKSSEAGLKYFILGAISSGFYLVGLTVLFLMGSSLELKEILMLSNETICSMGLIFITLSFCFKLSLFPLHFWVPDIYEGSPWEVISIMSTLPKISVLVVLIQILVNASLMIFIFILSIIIGTLGALNQSKIKRLLGYSGISNMGFVFLGYSIFVNDGLIVGNLYLIIYMITMISIFALLINFFTKFEYIVELSHLKFINKSLLISWALVILSIGGIPPLSGFIGKWFLLWNTVSYDYTISSFILILFSIISAGYYLRLVKIIYFQKKSSFFLWEKILESKKMENELSVLILGFCLFFSFFLIFNFDFLVDLLSISLIKCIT